ncbi:Ran-binding protein 3 [Porphyridium purpureum]|uniref:Ran-binding protein 3 n=1 Tax=Porphyridium purpureum TaxID=35688 RepID=A0A5J4ZA37_PORPP|nr:Ran-binding protein 3 [Porphyridium purpureum]|eukprot:POR1190..scf295_1
MKRASEEQLTKDAFEAREAADDAGRDGEERNGTGFQRASDEVIASRRIVKAARRSSGHAPVSAADSKSPSPFASIAADAQKQSPFASVAQSAAASDPAAAPAAATDEAVAKAHTALPTPDQAEKNDKQSDDAEPKEKHSERTEEDKTAEGSSAKQESTAPQADDPAPKFNFGTAPSFTFGSLASQAAGAAAPSTFPTGGATFSFGGTTGGLGSGTIPTWTFGAASKDGAAKSAGTEGVAGENAGADGDENPEMEVPIGPCQPILPEAEVITGEEKDVERFRSRAKVYQLEGKAWKERGVGSLKVNENSETEISRIIMRAEGSMRLVLNFVLWKDFKLVEASEKSARFAVVDSVPDEAGSEKREVKSFLVKFSSADDMSNFRAAVNSLIGAGAGNSDVKKVADKPTQE